MLPTEKSMTFFMMMFPAFFALVKPASTRANPACMNITRTAASTIQTSLTAIPTASNSISNLLAD
jgi:hypothetical protein